MEKKNLVHEREEDESEMLGRIYPRELTEALIRAPSAARLSSTLFTSGDEYQIIT